MSTPTQPTLRASLTGMRMRDRDLFRDFNLYLGKEIIGEYVTRNKAFEGINWRASTPAAVRTIAPETLEALALNG